MQHFSIELHLTIMKHLLLFFGFMVCSGIAFAQQPTEYQKKGAPLPKFIIEKTAGGTFTNANLNPGKPVMVMIFGPECDHCEHMVDSLKNIASMFKNTQLVMVAEDRNKKYMDAFIKKTGIASIPLFKNIGTNKGELIFAIYTYKVLPQITFYDGKHKLVKIFDGNYPLDSVKMFIK